MPSTGLTLTNTFGPLPGPVLLSQLDTNYSQLANIVNSLITQANYFVDSSGAANAITVTVPSPLIFSYAVGIPLDVKIANTNTGAVSINVNGAGAQALKNQDGSALVAGQMQAGGIYKLQFDGTNFQVVGGIAVPLYPRTQQEITATVIPTSLAYTTLDINRYGNFVGDNTHDDTNAWLNAIAVATALGGGIIRGLKGRISKTTATITGAANVIIDLEGGTINSNLVGTSGLDYGAFKFTSNFHVWNGTVNVLSSGSVGTQSGVHAAINIGPLYGDGGTSVAVSAFEGIYGWSCRNLTLHTNRAGKVCIQIMGGANNGVIDHIRCPDSSTVAGVVHADWGFVGTITSAAASMSANKTAFLAGTAWTTHPNAITITNIKAGNLTYNAANVGDCIRFSGVHGITVDNVEVDGTTNAGFYHTASDVGYEFAPTSIKPYAHRGITVRNFNVKNANNGWGFFHDTWADNVSAAITGFAYVPIIDPFGETDLTLERCFTTAGGGASVLPGFRFQNTRGGNIIDCEATGHLWGGIIDTVGHKVHVIRGRYWKNRNDGWAVGKSVSVAPQDCVLEDVFCDQNGQDGAYSPNAGIYVQSAVRLKIIRGKTGADGLVTETTQQRGIWIVDTTAINVSIKDHYVNAVKAGGTAYVVSSSTDYGILDVFNGNRADPGVSNFWAGVNIIPTLVEYGVDGIERRIFRCVRASLTASTTPTAGTWKLGDTIYYSDPTTADFIGTTCTVAGSPGTWKRFGATT